MFDRKTGNDKHSVPPDCWVQFQKKVNSSKDQQTKRESETMSFVISDDEYEEV